MSGSSEGYDVLAPNYLGDTMLNRGVDDLGKNQGLGVAESNPNAFHAAAETEKDRMRTAQARQFGKTKQTVGF
tara:strand:- start:375 stop:593 length:219 start_codon:yes stop_codon:yes gene_type:complete